jgi:hypothetical protein
MKFVGLASVVILFGLVVGYGLKCHREDERIASPGPGFYEHFAALQIRMRLRHEALAVAPRRTPKQPARSEVVGS